MRAALRCHQRHRCPRRRQGSRARRTGEVLVFRTVKDLVAGSGLRFEARGSYTLRGVPDEWRLFAVTS
jgi:hypothetical protein